MKLYAISDLHIDTKINRLALEALPEFPEDWLIIGGDVCNSEKYFRYALTILNQRFKQLLWVPGNHDLWSETDGEQEIKGEAKYLHLISICREHGVLTPEDPYAIWLEGGVEYVLAPLFILYDYTYRPHGLTKEEAIQLASKENSVCADEYYLNPTPYSSREEWCHVRVRYTEQRLSTIPQEAQLILINHFPLRQQLIRLKRIPRFSMWCGTRLTEDWHTRFPVFTVVSGHLHMRATDYIDGVRFEEVALGYPKHWQHERGIQGYLRQILPAPPAPAPNAGPFWHH